LFSSALRTLKIITLAAIAVVFIVFAAGNHEAVSLSLFPLPYAIELPKFLMAIVCVSLGAIFGAIAMSLKHSRARRRFTVEHKRASALENEIKSMRTHAETSPAIDSKI
jgi:lipopolysaccharide assembly protein A